MTSWNRKSYVKADCSTPPNEMDSDDEDVEQSGASFILDALNYSKLKNAICPAMPGTPCSAIIPSIIPANIAKDVQKKACFCDEFGFRTDPSRKMLNTCDKAGFPFTEDSRLRLEWIAYFEFTFNKVVEDLTWEKVESFLPKSSQLEQLVRKGVPHSLRPYVWPRLCGAMNKRQQSDFSYSDLSKATGEEKFIFSQIEKDLLRTLPNNICFSQPDSHGVCRLRRVLRALSLVFPSIGYCQGIGVIVAILLLFLDEENVFWMMLTIVEDLLPDQYYSDPMLGAMTDQRVFRLLIAKLLPKVDAILNNHDIEPSLITLHWFMTIYSLALPFNVLLRVWDQFFYQGSVVLFRLALALLKLKENNLRVLTNSAEVFNLLSELPSLFDDVELILKAMDAFQSCVDEDSLEALRKKQSAYILANESNGDLSTLDTGEQRRHFRIKRSRSMVGHKNLMRKRSFHLSSNLQTVDNDLKNVKQTELMLQLKEVVQALAKHMVESDCVFSSDVNLQADYSLKSHEADYERYVDSHQPCRRLARALVDFERRDEDDLGFKKYDLITVLSRKDEHCWIGELNGVRGWFPAKFVEFLHDQLKDYLPIADDGFSERTEIIVRQRLCSALKEIFEYGIKKSTLLGRRLHPWMFFENVASFEGCKDLFNVQNRLVLCQTFQLDEDGQILSSEELFHKAMQYINAKPSAGKTSMDLKFRSLICLGLNEQVLHLWFELLCSCQDVVDKFYHSFSFIRSPGWVQVKCELRVLCQFMFKLSTDWELPDGQKHRGAYPIQNSVTDMLIKHHLFSWDTAVPWPMSAFGDDCYYFYYSKCSKGAQCNFRHSESALGTELVCDAWLEKRCFRANCPYRHMKIITPRINTPCYWENQPSGCLKKHCVFKHSKPRDNSLSYEDYTPTYSNDSGGSTKLNNSILANSLLTPVEQSDENEVNAVGQSDAFNNTKPNNSEQQDYYSSEDNESVESEDVIVTVGETIDPFSQLESAYMVDDVFSNHT